MKVTLSLHPFWIKDDRGCDASVLSVFTSLKGTPNEIKSRRTLSQAYSGTLEGSNFTNTEKLRQIACQFAGRNVSLEELMIVSE